MFPKMIDMALTPAEKLESAMPYAIGSTNNYPYGLCICLGNDQLEKLGLEEECEVGDFIHLFALAKVTSVSKNDTGEGEKVRIELQITHMGLESEDEENEEGDEEEDKVIKVKRPHLYKK